MITTKTERKITTIKCDVNEYAQHIAKDLFNWFLDDTKFKDEKELNEFMDSLKSEFDKQIIINKKNLLENE